MAITNFSSSEHQLRLCLLWFTYLEKTKEFYFLNHNSFNILACHFYFNIPLKFSSINYLPFLHPILYTSSTFHLYPVSILAYYFTFSIRSFYTAGDVLLASYCHGTLQHLKKGARFLVREFHSMINHITARWRSP